MREPAPRFEKLHESPSSFEVEGAMLQIINEGEPQAGSRLLIQGLGCEAETIWRPVLSELDAHGDETQNLAFNMRGIGESTGWPQSLEQMADDAAALLEAKAGQPTEVIGHSLGGVVAILLAARHPSLVKSLVLMDTVPSYSEKTRSGFLWRADEIRKAKDISTIFDIVIPRSFGNEVKVRDPDTIATFEAMLARQSPETYAHVCELAANADAWSAFAVLEVPTLFMSGSEDIATSPEIMKPLAAEAKGQFIEIPQAGHNPPLEQAAFVAAAILGFSTSLRAS